jgi:hypothetical protein
MQIFPKNLVNWLVQYKLVGFQQAALPQEALSSKYGIPFNVLLYWMKVGWLHEKAIEKINHICIKRKVF